MANDNPEKYVQDGGLHIERMLPEDIAAEGLDPDKGWILFGIKEGAEVVSVAMFPTDYALKVADAIKKLATQKI